MRQPFFTRDRSYYRSMLTLALPVALQNLISFLVTFADNLMVNTLGDAAVSGVYMGSQIQVFLTMFSGGIAGTLVILGSQYRGKNDSDSIRRLTAIALRISLIVGVVFTVLCLAIPEPLIRLFTQDEAVVADGITYLRITCLSFTFYCVTQALIASMRSVEITFVGMAVSVLSLIANIIGNYVLIFGKFGFEPMGVKGAAIATLLSRIVETAFMLVYVMVSDKRLAFRAKDLFRFDRVLRRDFIRYGTPLVSGEIVWSVNMLCNSIILGGYGAGVITGTSVANTLNTLAFVAIGGFANALGIVTGKTVGAGKLDKMREYARTTQVLFLGLGLVIGAIVFALKNPFVSLYGGISQEAAGYARQFIAVLSVTIIGSAYQMPCLYGLVKCGGDISFVFRNDTIFVFLVVLPSAALSAHFGMPAWVTFACLKSDQILKCFVAVVKVNRFNWMKNLTRDKKQELTEK